MVARFAHACDLLGLRFGMEPIVVACSGGADSAAALLLTRAVAPDAKLLACYVDHRLRPRASIARDLEAVRAHARAAQAEVVVCRITPKPRGGKSPGSLEEWARTRRYRALEETARQHEARIVVTGHQRDDLVETSLLALVRGSGIDGIAAMRPKRALSHAVALARPLLWATKAQCTAYVLSRGLVFSQDETNDDVRIPRNAVRALLSQLERSIPQASRNIARSAALLADDRGLLAGMSAMALQRARASGSSDLLASALRRLPVSLVRRIVRSAVASSGFGLRDFSFVHCDAIARAVKAGRGGRFHAGSATVVLSSGKLVVEPAEPSVPSPVAAAIDLRRLPAVVRTPLGIARFSAARRGTSRENSSDLELDLDGLRAEGDISLRTPRPGEECVPSGRRRPASLARFLAKAGVPVNRRSRVALLCAGGRIAAVLGLRAMEPFRAAPGKPVLRVAWQPADS